MNELTPNLSPGGDRAESRQRRGSRRRPLEATVQVIEPRPGTGVTINVSDGGMRVAVDCALTPNAICLMVVREAGHPEQLVRARVAWSDDREGDGCIAGLQRLGLH